MLLLKFEKCACREKAVTASLVLWPNPHNVELLSELAKSSMKTVSKLHEILHVKNARKVKAENMEKVCL